MVNSPDMLIYNVILTVVAPYILFYNNTTAMM